MSNAAFVHRNLNFGPHNKVLFHGPDVLELQKAINEVCAWRKWTLIAADGECGRQTIATGRRVGASLGILLNAPGLSIYAQHLIRHPNQRTPAQKARGKKWQAAHPANPQVSGNTVTGGATDAERIVEGAIAAWQHWAKYHDRFYSQPGYWDVSHGITGEAHGARSDCSQWVTSIFHSAGAPDPNGNGYKGGYTGTLGAAGTYVSMASRKPCYLILYGPAPHHHVELFIGPGTRTIGHGSPPVDPGDIYMMADPHCVRPPGIG